GRGRPPRARRPRAALNPGGDHAPPPGFGPPGRAPWSELGRRLPGRRPNLGRGADRPVARDPWPGTGRSGQVVGGDAGGHLVDRGEAVDRLGDLDVVAV